MIVVPDINLLIYTFNASAPDHERAVAWWEGLLNSQQAVGIPWVVLLGFLRLMSGRHVLREPLSPEDASALADEWFLQPNVRLLSATPRTRLLLSELIARYRLAGAVITDAAIAATAMEHGGVVHTNDTDFARFSQLRTKNPLAS